jgi:dipeptidyl aminopeptidase/acylaminoacyl peptidase
VSYVGAQPVFVDVGSFERLREGEPWAGYRQFCTLFLYPLMLQAYRGIAPQSWLRGSLEGIEPADLIREGIVAKDRICLMGASYGGYAALWGLMKTPDLYRCGIAAFPVTAIEQLFDFNVNARFRSAWYQLGGKIRVGDPEKDRDKFRKVSPLYQTDLLKAPILLVYGGADEVTPVKYGNAFRSALERSGKKYEWVVYPKEAHGLNVDENRFDFYRRVETFLKLHLAPSDPAKLQ